MPSARTADGTVVAVTGDVGWGLRTECTNFAGIVGTAATCAGEAVATFHALPCLTLRDFRRAGAGATSASGGASRCSGRTGVTSAGGSTGRGAAAGAGAFARRRRLLDFCQGCGRLSSKAPDPPTAEANRTLSASASAFLSKKLEDGTGASSFPHADVMRSARTIIRRPSTRGAANGAPMRKPRSIAWKNERNKKTRIYDKRSQKRLQRILQGALSPPAALLKRVRERNFIHEKKKKKKNRGEKKREVKTQRTSTIHQETNTCSEVRPPERSNELLDSIIRL